MTAIVAYYRVSTPRQGQSGLGLEAQRAAVRGYALAAARPVVAEFTEVKSGRSRDRPQLAAALARVRECGATLAVAKLDRLARDVGLVLELVGSGARLLFLDFPDLDTEGAMGRLVLTVMASFAEFESRRIGERTAAAAAARKARAAAGREVRASRARSPEHQRRASAAMHARERLLAAEFRARHRPLAAALRAGGMTLAAVAAELNRVGVATRRGRAWTPGLVWWLLRP